MLKVNIVVHPVLQGWIHLPHLRIYKNFKDNLSWILLQILKKYIVMI